MCPAPPLPYPSSTFTEKCPPLSLFLVWWKCHSAGCRTNRKSDVFVLPLGGCGRPDSVRENGESEAEHMHNLSSRAAPVFLSPKVVVGKRKGVLLLSTYYLVKGEGGSWTDPKYPPLFFLSLHAAAQPLFPCKCRMGGRGGKMAKLVGQGCKWGMHPKWSLTLPA